MRHWITLLALCLPLLAVAAEPEVRVQSRLVPADGVLVGGTVAMQVDLLVDTWFTAAPILAKLDLAGAVVNPPSGEAEHLTEKHDGKTFFGLRYTYQITPQTAQRFSIPALEFQVQPGQAGGPVKVHSQPLAFEANGAVGTGGEQRLVARQVGFTQNIQRSHDPLRVGDSITRSLTLRAEGAQAMLLPQPELAEVDGLKRYLKTPIVKRLDDGRGGIDGGIREDSVTYVIATTGHFALPAIELQWWDAKTGEAQRISLPAVQLNAREGAYQAPFSISDDLHALGQKAQVRLAGHWLLLTAVLLVVGCLFWFGRPWARSIISAWTSWRVKRHQARLASAGYAWQLASSQLAAKPLQLDGLYLWNRRSSGLLTLRELSGELPIALANPLLALLESRYGRHPLKDTAADEPGRKLQELGRELARRKTASRGGQGLKPLNP